MARIAATLLAVVFAAALTACGGSSSSSSSDQITAETSTVEDASGEGEAEGELEGEVGPGFEIEVKQNGEDAESVPAGTYTLKVEDKSDMHNFHLIGSGVDVATDVSFEGDKTFTVTLKPGTYTYQCDPHASSGMKGTFEVTES
jgi:plastocyanin